MTKDGDCHKKQEADGQFVEDEHESTLIENEKIRDSEASDIPEVPEEGSSGSSGRSS
jgi:hypothetical protein